LLVDDAWEEATIINIGMPCGGGGGGIAAAASRRGGNMSHNEGMRGWAVGAGSIYDSGQ
jgi:hypothetical protein